MSQGRPDLKVLEEDDLVPELYKTLETVGWPFLIGGLIVLAIGLFMGLPLFFALFITIMGGGALTIAKYKANITLQSHKSKAKKLRPPHQALENFIHWQSGDELGYDLSNYLSSYNVPRFYIGVLDDNSIVLMDEPKPEWANEAARVSADFLKDVNVKNKGFIRRSKEKQVESLNEALNDSQYEGFLNTVQNEFEKLESQNERNIGDEGQLDKMEEGDIS